MKKRNCVLICTIVFLIILAVILVVVRMTPDQKYKRAMKNAERYMNKLEYKQAGLQYEAAVEIKPKEAEPHLGLAAVYISIADGFDEDNTEEISEYYNLAKKEYEMAEEYGAKHSDLAVVAEGIEKIEKNAGLAEPSPEALDPPKPTVEPTA
ncbi:MAG: hypothetical protein Q4B22_07035, partial [Eubacteriales bacterium]|nr:hypothetical protein [Eubacteriales bacterium]